MARTYGWVPSRPDHRDLQYAPVSGVTRLPTKVDLRENAAMPAVWDQGDLGSCTAHGGGALFAFLHALQTKETIMPARLAIYYNTRDLEGTVQYDSGASVRDCMRAMNKQGVPNEALWPYDTTKFKDKPPKSVYVDGAKHRVTRFEAVDHTKPNLLKHALATGKPVVFGFTVYESFEGAEVAKTGIVPMPGAKESALGGHCVLLVGYDDERSVWIVRNSWGPRWGDNGYCYFNYNHLTDAKLAADFWVADVVI